MRQYIFGVALVSDRQAGNLVGTFAELIDLLGGVSLWTWRRGDSVSMAHVADAAAIDPGKTAYQWCR